jgi:hypothetical protein
VAGEPAGLSVEGSEFASPKGSEFTSPSLMDPCLSCAPFTRPTQTGVGGRRLVPDPTTSGDSGSYRLKSSNLSVMKRRDPRTHLDPGRNLVVD